MSAVTGLADEVRSQTRFAIDDLQVAAYLESIGITDDEARTGFGRPDVFELAGEVRRLTRAEPPARPPTDEPPFYDDLGASRALHGLVYLVPALTLPAVLTFFAPGDAVAALVTGGGLGWVWSGVMSWMAFARRGQGRPAAAAVVMLRLVRAGLVMAVPAGLVVAAATGGGWPVLLLTWSLTAYQLAATQLFFLGRRAWLALAGAPAALGGILHLAWPESSLLPTVVVVVAALGTIAALVLGAARARTVCARRDEHPRMPQDRLGLVELLAYSALSAAFLLLPQVLLIGEGFDTAVGLGALIVTMGVVEWQAVELGRQARRLLTRCGSPTQFRRALAGVLGRHLAVSMGIAAGAGIALGLLLLALGRLTAGGVVVLVAGALLAGGYLSAFALANVSGYRLLICALVVLVAAEIVLLALGVAPSRLILAVAVGLLVLMTAGLMSRPVASFR